jgi:phosphate transport system substrate-binding protein
VNKAEGRSTLEIFTTYLKIEPREIQADIVIGDNEQGVKTVAGNPAAIGYVSVGTAQFDKEAGTPIKLLPANGIAATVDNVGNGSFPISRPLNLVTSEEPSGDLKELIEYAQSAEVFDLVEELSFVPIR